MPGAIWDLLVEVLYLTFYNYIDVTKNILPEVSISRIFHIGLYVEKGNSFVRSNF